MFWQRKQGDEVTTAESAWDVKGRIALVTGAGSGINLAFAEQLLDAGCSVLFADIALTPDAEVLLARFPHDWDSSSSDSSSSNSRGDGKPSAVYKKTDQSDWAQISATWEFALQTFGRVDLLCPGAGIWEPPFSAFWEAPGISPHSCDDPAASPGNYKSLAVNLIGPIRFAQIALDYWLAHKMAGNLIVIASQAAYVPTVGAPLYIASKGGLVSFARSLAQMKARLGVRVTCMCPSTTFTPAVLPDYCAGKVREEDMNMTPRECAAVMLRLVSEPQYGNGEVVEAMQYGTKQKSDVRVRNVPYEALAPELDLSGDYPGKNIAVEEEKLWAQLKTKGMRP